MIDAYGDVSIPSSVAPGTYTFDICVADTDSQSACAQSTAIVQASSATPLPNLTPYQPPGWSAPIIVSTASESVIDSSLFLSTDTLYVNWSVINNGDAPTAATFTMLLYIDGVSTLESSLGSPFVPGSYLGFYPSVTLGSLSAGPHTLKLVVDSTNAVDESNENDNTYSKTITVVSPPVCTFSISPASNSIGAVGGNGQVAITASKDCLWSATSNAGWINLTSGINGNANGVVGYSVAANTATTSRSGTITIAGKTFTITQAGTALACTVSISPSSANFQAGIGYGDVNVTAASTCAWSATSSDDWISIVPPVSGTGNGTVQFTVAANPNTSSRSGTITISNQTYTVTQSGSLCTVTLSPAISVNHVPSGGASGVVYVTLDPTAPAGCAWQATSQDTWIIVTSASGAGDGSVGYSVAANPGTSPRTGTITIADQTFTIMQDGSSCTYMISPPSNSVASSGGSGFTVSVTAASGCIWSATSNDAWITVTSGASGTGNGTVYYSVAPNTSSSPLNGSITIAGQTFTVTEAGSSTSGSQTFGGAFSGSTTFQITDGIHTCYFPTTISAGTIQIVLTQVDADGSVHGNGNFSGSITLDEDAGAFCSNTGSSYSTTFTSTDAADYGVEQPPLTGTTSSFAFLGDFVDASSGSNQAPLGLLLSFTGRVNGTMILGTATVSADSQISSETGSIVIPVTLNLQ